MRPRLSRPLVRIACLAAAAAAVGVSVPAASAPLPMRYLLVTVTPEAGQAVPSDARVSAITQALEAQGLSVTRGPGLLLEAHGRVAAPQLTGALATDVSGVVDSAVGSVRWKAHASAPVTGSQLLQAYGVPSPPLAPTAAPVLTTRTPIVASIQLSGWNAGDLTQYAATQSYAGQPLYTTPTYDPVASGQYTPVSVDRSPATASGDAGGENEVALDQEALLAVAPQLKQRAYFAQNVAPGSGTTGILGAFNSVLRDVTNGLPIVALTTSWGNCEDTSLAFASFRTSLETVLQSLNAQGVTVFAASGDAGAYDCAPDTTGANLLDPAYSTPAVDYPCSSPWVECVGGTVHPNGAGAAAPDTAWDEGDSSGAYKGSGSGGGASTVFARPSWQAGVTTGNQRLVPDFALDGAPSTGLVVVVNGTNKVIGGTSLSSPAAAAMVSDIVAQHVSAGSTPRGLGDIHAALYAHANAFVDVVAPTTSTAIQPAGPGYDQSTGLGTPSWSALTGVLDITPPKVTVTSWKREAATNTYLLGSWNASDANGIKAYAITITADGASKPALTKVFGPTQRKVRFKGKAGTTYTLVAYAADPSNNLGAATSAPVALPFDDRAASVSSGWARKGNGRAYGSTVTVSAKQGATAKLVVKGRTLGVAVDFGPANGVFLLLVDGKPVKTVDTGGAARWAVPITVTRPAGKHTITIRVLGVPGRGSGSTVSLDAIIAH